MKLSMTLEVHVAITATVTSGSLSQSKKQTEDVRTKFWEYLNTWKRKYRRWNTRVSQFVPFISYFYGDQIGRDAKEQVIHRGNEKCI